MRKRLFKVARLLAASYIIFATPLIFAAKPGSPSVTAERRSPIWSIEFSPDGKTLAVGKYQWIELWDLETQRLIHTYEPHAGEVRSLRFSSHGASDPKNQQETPLRLYAGGGIAAQSGEVRGFDRQAKWLTQHVERVLCTLYHPESAYFSHRQ